MVKAPVTSHATNSQPADRTWRLMSADTMKMPEPIIDPATSMVESSKPRLCTNFLSGRAGLVSTAGIPAICVSGRGVWLRAGDWQCWGRAQLPLGALLLVRGLIPMAEQRPLL